MTYIQRGEEMKQYNTIYNNAKEFEEFLATCKIHRNENMLVQMFTGIVDEKYISETIFLIKSMLPNATVIGATTAGEIVNGKVTENMTVLSISIFEKTRVDSIILDQVDPRERGKKIVNELICEDTKAVVLFNHGMDILPNPILDEIKDAYPDIVIAGGIAADNGHLKRTLVFLNDRIVDFGTACFSLSGKELSVKNHYKLNWRPVGKKMIVTKANDNIVHSIDNIPVKDLYCKYLGEEVASGIPYIAGLFPLVKEHPELTVCRSMFAYNEDGSAVYAGNMNEGDMVRFAFANVNMILDNTYLDNFDATQIEAVYIYSCMMRKVLLKDDVELETKPIAEKFPMAGFFTYGEFYSLKGYAELLTESMTMLFLSESNQISVDTKMDNKDFKELDIVISPTDTILRAITHLTDTVSREIEEQNKLLAEQEQYYHTLLDSQDQLIITTDGRQIHYVNEAFLDFFEIESLDEFTSSSNCISDYFHLNNNEGFLKKHIGEQSWIEHIINYPNRIHKAEIQKNDTSHVFSVTAARLPIKNREIMSAIFTDITSIEDAKVKIELLHKKTRDSIKYASFIQSTILPGPEKIQAFFSDAFVIWEPKDIVSGDVWFFEQIDDDEFLIFMIDCTGHGVPGGFVTMLVKSIERNIVNRIGKSKDEIYPSELLREFHKNIGQLLKNDNRDLDISTGFDGGIVYINKKSDLLRFAGAEMSLFMMEKDKDVIRVKGNHQSVGSSSSLKEFKTVDHDFNLSEIEAIFLTTDGYFDQIGGAKGLPFGIKHFVEVLEKGRNNSCEYLKKSLLNNLDKWQGNEERNDDIAIVGIYLND